MLPIAIDLYINVISKMLSIFMSSLNSATDTEILRQIQYIDIFLSTNIERVVRGPIINHNVVIASSNH